MEHTRMTLRLWERFQLFVLPMVVIAIFAFAGSAAWRLQTAPRTAPQDLVSLEGCFTHTEFTERIRCYRPMLEHHLDMHGPRAVLAALDRLQEQRTQFRAECHTMAHILGRYWIASGKLLADGFREGTNICHSGFFHGMAERVFQGEDASLDEPAHLSPEELRARIATVCTDEALRTPSRNMRFQCLHGLGHAAVFSLSYDLLLALEMCDVLPTEWDQSSCAGGAFMENITGMERDRRMLRAGDPHYPCSIVPSRHRKSCYGMQTSWMLESGMNWDAIIAACRTAGDARLACFQSFGRDVSPRVREKGPTEFVSLCTQLQPDERSPCIRGAVYALADHTWDGRYAFPFCAAFPDGALGHACFTEAQRHLLYSLEQTRAATEQGCAALGTGREACLQSLQTLASS